ncbi:hypothetical protein B0H34DRAFT_620001, partial [Crassisporium funariophilum]
QSTVHKGNAFEERSLNLLQQTMSMTMTRVGGKEDGGIDLLGWWWLPHDAAEPSRPTSSSTTRRRIRVIGQCKAEKKKTGPKYVRELEGVLYRFLANSNLGLPASVPPDTDSALFLTSNTSSIPVMALLISESPFTKSAVLRAFSSPIPLLLLYLPPLENDSAIVDDDYLGTLGAALCNPSLAGTQGLLQGNMEVRWERFVLGGGGRPALWWKHQKLQSWTP